MATKPGTIPSIWASSTVYTTGPFIGQPNLSIPAGAVAIDGHRPGAADPTPAEYQNYQQHWGSRWIVDWLTQGLAVPGANTHIVETDANGRTEIIGLDITDVVDRTVATWVASNTIVPAFILRTNGNGFQSENAGAGTSSYNADLSGGSAIGFTAVDGPADAGTGLNILLQGSGSFGTLTGTGAGTNGLDLNLTSSTRDTLVLTNGGSGSPLRSTPQTPPASLLPGQQWCDTLNDDWEGVRPSGSLTRFWSSEQGYNVTFTENGVAAVPAGAYISFAYGFVAGKTYIFDYSFSYGRIAGSTRDIIDNFNVGGIAFPVWAGRTIGLFQGGGVGQIEGNWTRQWVWTSFVTGVFAVNLDIFQTGAGVNLQVDSGCLTVTGALD